ncbi:MAG: hypothetical protein PGN07_10055 [Aeromicrobium erythreum]
MYRALLPDHDVPGVPAVVLPTALCLAGRQVLPRLGWSQLDGADSPACGAVPGLRVALGDGRFRLLLGGRELLAGDEPDPVAPRAWWSAVGRADRCVVVVLVPPGSAPPRAACDWTQLRATAGALASVATLDVVVRRPRPDRVEACRAGRALASARHS